MKKLFFIFAMLLAITSMSANGILVDKVKDGFRFVQTERTPHVFLVKGTMNDGAVSLDYRSNDEFKQYSVVLYFYSDYNIEKGAKLLLKLDNDEIMELSSNDKASSTYVGNAFAQILVSFVSYDLTTEQLKKIMTHNVVKLRVETFSGFLNGKVYGKKFSKAISSDYKEIQKALSKKNSLYEGF